MNGTPITMVQALMLHGFIHYAPVRMSDLTEDVMCVPCSSRQVFRCRSVTEKLRFRSKNINVRFKVAQVAMTQDLSPSIRVSSDSIIPTMFHIYSPHPTLCNLSNWRHPSTNHYKKKFHKIVCQTFLLEEAFWLRRIATDPHSLSHVNMACPDDRYRKTRNLYLRNDF